jgi:acyl-CoA synthetase (AMP-forming)/AMP-acid ligase II
VDLDVKRPPGGFVYLTGRAKDLIIRGGHNIAPG